MISAMLPQLTFLRFLLKRGSMIDRRTDDILLVLLIIDVIYRVQRGRKSEHIRFSLTTSLFMQRRKGAAQQQV